MLKAIKKTSGSCTEKYQDHIPCCFTYKLVCVDNKFSKPVILYRGENATYKFIKAIPEDYEYCKKVEKKHFICEKLTELTDHCHMMGKYRGAAHWKCDVNFNLTKKVPVIFYKVDVNVSVIPTGLE